MVRWGGLSFIYFSSLWNCWLISLKFYSYNVSFPEPLMFAFSGLSAMYVTKRLYLRAWLLREYYIFNVIHMYIPPIILLTDIRWISHFFHKYPLPSSSALFPWADLPSASFSQRTSMDHPWSFLVYWPLWIVSQFSWCALIDPIGTFTGDFNHGKFSRDIWP